jgi:Flp pilus assembly pilin Flp
MKMKSIMKDDRGAATAEYAIATMAAVGFAGLLVIIMRSDEVRQILFDLVKSALTFTNPNDAPSN